MNETTNHFDLIVIGGGSAGYAAARTAAGMHKNVAIVDGAKTLGGLCILKGCMPSKTLIYSAEILWHAKNAKEFGLDIPNANVDMQALQKRKTEIIDDFAQYRQEQLKSDRFTLFRSHAKFVNSQSVELQSGEILSGEKFIISTGSKVKIPNITGLRDVPCWTSDDILDLDCLPEAITVLGGGVIALELAQMLHRLGSRVTLLQRNPRLIKEYSEKVSQEILDALRAEGITINTGCEFESVSHTDNQFIVQWKANGESRSITTPHLLNTMGREPNTDGLDLDQCNVKTKSSGHIDTNEHQQTTNPNIYACGDCAGPHEIVHIAIKQGEHAAEHAFTGKGKPVSYDNLMTVIFTDPQIAQVGLGEIELKSQGIPYVEADYPFDDHGKSILMNAKHGYVRLFACPNDGTLLGAECVGKDAGELIHAMSVAVTLKAKASDLLKANWYHPTLSEIWEYPLEDIVDEISH